MLSRLILALLICGLVTPTLFAVDSQLIKAGHLISPETGAVLENATLWIENGVVKEINPKTPPAHAEVIDLGAYWVVPGLIDCHTHLAYEIENYIEDRFRRSPIDLAVSSHVFALKTIRAGFTSVRNVGAGEFVDVAMKKAILQGRFPGPRMWVAGHTLSATGGHGDTVGFSPYIEFHKFDAIADGVDEIRKKVRWNIKYGADLIKFTATAGVLSEEESVGAPQYSLEEMTALVEEAHRWHRKVAAHAHGTEGIKLAVRAGVDSIEHGSTLDDEAIAMMKERGTYLVPTVFAGDSVVLYGKKWGLPDRLIEKAKTINEKKREGYRKAIQQGVKVAYGTDVGVFPHGDNAVDFKLLVDLGMTPLQALQSATLHAADLMGQKGKIGGLIPGAFGDLVALKDNPLKDITTLERPAWVILGGKKFQGAEKKSP